MSQELIELLKKAYVKQLKNPDKWVVPLNKVKEYLELGGVDVMELEERIKLECKECKAPLERELSLTTGGLCWRHYKEKEGLKNVKSTITKKKCAGPCEEELPATTAHFQRDKRTKDNLSKVCLGCLLKEPPRAGYKHNTSEVIPYTPKEETMEDKAKNTLENRLKELEKIIETDIENINQIKENITKNTTRKSEIEHLLKII